MPFEFPIGIGRNPLVNNIFVQEFHESGDFPPPTTNFMITEISQIMVTETGQKMITE